MLFTRKFNLPIWSLGFSKYTKVLKKFYSSLCLRENNLYKFFSLHIPWILYVSSHLRCKYLKILNSYRVWRAFHKVLALWVWKPWVTMSKILNFVLIIYCPKFLECAFLMFFINYVCIHEVGKYVLSPWFSVQFDSLSEEFLIGNIFHVYPTCTILLFL